MVQDSTGLRSKWVLTNYLSIDWRLSGASCKTTHFPLEGGAPGVCWLTGKVLTLGGRRQSWKKLSLGACILSHGCFWTPFFARRSVGVQGFLEPAPLAETCSHLQPLLGLILRSGAPPQPPLACHPASLRHPLLCKGSGSLHTGLPGAADEEPHALGSLSAASPQPHGCAGSPSHPQLALNPSLQPSRPERAHRGSSTWARGRRRPLLPLPEPKPQPARSPSMLRALQPPSAQPLAQAQRGEPAKQQRGGGHSQEEGHSVLGQAGLWARGARSREEAAQLSRSVSAPATAEGSRQCDASPLLGGSQQRLPVAVRPTPAPIPRVSLLSIPTRPATGAWASAKSEARPQRHQLPWEPLSQQQPAPALGAMRPQPGGAPSANSPPMGSTALGCPAWSA